MLFLHKLRVRATTLTIVKIRPRWIAVSSWAIIGGSRLQTLPTIEVGARKIAVLA